MSKLLLEKISLGKLELKNRIIMSPLTRARAGEKRVPNELMAKYYAQRASAGLIISEATSITPSAVGYANTPGIWNEEQVQGWKLVTKAVHDKGGKIVLQLWHVGRISDPLFLDGELPVAPSAIKPEGHVSLVRPIKEYETPRALETSEVKSIVNDYKIAARNAKEAGFDGIELHAANGYLIDQFLQSKTNHRTDEYGGPVENRSRFLLEITDAVLEVWDAGRVGVHLAPACDNHDMGDDNPKETFGYVAKELGSRNIAFIFTREGQGENYLTPHIKNEFKGPVIANQGLDLKAANELLSSGVADAVAWGRYYISTPDLVERVEKDKPFNDFNPDTFYGSGEEGYTDYPFLND